MKVNGVEQDVPIVMTTNEIFAKQGNLKGWSRATPKAFENYAEYVLPETAGRSKKMGVNKNTRETALKDMQEYFNGAGANLIASQTDLYKRLADIGGANADVVMFEGRKLKTIDSNNYDQLQAAVSELTANMSPNITDGLRDAFNSDMKQRVLVAERNSDGTPVMEEVDVQTKDAQGNTITKKVKQT